MIRGVLGLAVLLLVPGLLWLVSGCGDMPAGDGGHDEYEEDVSAGWSVTGLDCADPAGMYASMDIGRDGKVHIAYYHVWYSKGAKDEDFTESWSLGYIVGAGDDWDRELFALGDFTEVMDTSIAVGPDGRTHIAYYSGELLPDYRFPSLVYLLVEPGEQREFEAVSEVYGYDLSMCVDGDGAVHILFFDRGRGLMHICGLFDEASETMDWTLETVDAGDDIGQHPSVVCGPRGSLHVSYMDHAEADLKYAVRADGGWRISVVDSEGDVGWFTSIGLDSAGSVHISYYGDTDGDLKYATNASGEWRTFVVDSEGDVGGYTSLAVDSNDGIHISYYDFSNRSLKYATNASGEWETVTVHSVSFGAVGEFSAIALDPDGGVHIAYFHRTRGCLYYATDSRR